MKVVTEKLTKIVLSDLHALDPIDVIFEDTAPKQGKVTITCYGQSWTTFWGSMGDRTVAEFFLSAGDDYIASKLYNGPEYVDDFEKLMEQARSKVLELRRERCISEAEARDLFERTSHTVSSHWECDEDLLTKTHGPEWFLCIPTKTSHQYEYVRRIVQAIQTALLESEQWKEAA